LAEHAKRPLGLYVHWPFCLSKCPYCDFNSHVRARIDADAYAAALVRELHTLAARLDHVRPLTSIFFGGGTPSLMPGECVRAVIDAARQRFGFEPGIEITLEANPTSVEADRFRAYRDAGVNRLSLGVQALDDADLRALGRMHGVDEAMRAVDLAQSVFDRVSFDLIYARPTQSLEAWDAELARALAVGCAHYALYQLTFEEGTPFHAARARGLMKELGPEISTAMYELTQQRMQAAGRPAYEISNHARPGEESRHNLLYWRYGDYLGIGPGAHGRIGIDGGRVATETLRAPEEWLARVTADGQGVKSWETVAPSEAFTEAVLMGLRLTEGINVQALEAETGQALPPNRVRTLCDQGLLVSGDGRLAATPSGRLVLNSVLRVLLA
jgi:putative oxygen-independent coproporphyrinogen III oxidase